MSNHPLQHTTQSNPSRLPFPPKKQTPHVKIPFLLILQAIQRRFGVLWVLQSIFLKFLPDPHQFCLPNKLLLHLFKIQNPIRILFLPLPPRSCPNPRSFSDPRHVQIQNRLFSPLLTQPKTILPHSTIHWVPKRIVFILRSKWNSPFVPF